MIEYVKGLYHDKLPVRVVAAFSLLGVAFVAGYHVHRMLSPEPRFDIPEELLSALSTAAPDTVVMNSAFGPGLWERAIALEVRLVDTGNPVDILVVVWCSDRRTSIAANIIHRDREAESLWSNNTFTVPAGFFREQCRS